MELRDHRFFINDFFENKIFELTKFDAHHIINVLRLKIGDLIEIAFLDKVYLCEIKKIEKQKLFILPKEYLYSIKEEKTKINLITAIPKLNRYDILLEKCTELGINEIIPIITKRSIKKNITKTIIDRQKKIILSAAKQSRRDTIPKLYEPINIFDLIALIKKDSLKIVFYEKSNNVINSINFDISNNIYYLIGPEGSLTDEEIKYLIENNFISVKLNTPILRVETAAITGLIVILNKLNKI
ncbi:MAG TPA: RsmE family RNA methyltransferase [bacterium]|nr:RsmE family RNA methyltransferase [bacterium]HOL46829.1 RsmE family RNA methyltransferase [bacterium]HPQ18645.1 RsmE family RNA methyltransferase [bacterium]